MTEPQIFSISHTEIFQSCVDIYQNETGYVLERQDAERLMIKIFADQIHFWGSAWLVSSRQIFLKNMTGQQLDDYGEFFGIDRADNTAATSIVRFSFTEEIELATQIYKNTVITGSNDNGTYNFKVTEDTYVPKNTNYIDITVTEFLTESTNSGVLANGIEIGELDTLDESSYSYSFVDSVTNLVESSGGIASEIDDDYRDRLYFGPGQYSTAGVADAYIYHAVSASANIVSVGLIKDNWDINLYVLPKNYDGEFNLELIGDDDDQLDNLVLNGLTLDNTDKGKLYWNLIDSGGSRSFTLYKDEAKTSMVAGYVGPDDVGALITQVGGSGITGTVDIAYTTDDTDTTNEVLSAIQAVAAVHELMYPEVGNSKVRPLNDPVTTQLVEKKTFEITNIEIEINSSNVDAVTNSALLVTDIFIDNTRNRVGVDVVRSALSGALSSIDGVSDVLVEIDGDPLVTKIAATQGQVYFGSFTPSNLTVTVSQ